MKAAKKKTRLYLLIIVFFVGFICTGCVSEETRDGRGTIKSYHRSGLALAPEPK
jgi:hypothetical protein